MTSMTMQTMFHIPLGYGQICLATTKATPLWRWSWRPICGKDTTTTKCSIMVMMKVQEKWRRLCARESWKMICGGSWGEEGNKNHLFNSMVVSTRRLGLEENAKQMDQLQWHHGDGMRIKVLGPLWHPKIIRKGRNNWKTKWGGLVTQSHLQRTSPNLIQRKWRKKTNEKEKRQRKTQKSTS